MAVAFLKPSSGRNGSPDHCVPKQYCIKLAESDYKNYHFMLDIVSNIYEKTETRKKAQMNVENCKYIRLW